MKFSIKIFTLLLLIATISFAWGSEKAKPEINKYVEFKASVSEKTIKAGSTGTIRITLKPTKGIHINVDPPMSLKLDSLSSITKIDEVKADKDEVKGYLDYSEPITIKFTVAKDAKPGKITLKGTFIYFFCSDAEGWCNKYKQPIEVNANISK